jgi:alpha-glucosidase (family GH31 glycosyl hydrolase)
MHLPWAYGAEAEEICRRYVELRYRLMPYTYTLAWQAHRSGLSLMRPLVLNYPDDPQVWELASEFLWGDDILVAPVTRGGVTHWPVYLPKGVWHDFWTNEVFRGPLWVSAPAPLDRLPLFVRSGAILPLGPVTQHWDGRLPADMTILVYPEGRSSFTLYEDDGETNSYRTGGGSSKPDLSVRRLLRAPEFASELHKGRLVSAQLDARSPFRSIPRSRRRASKLWARTAGPISRRGALKGLSSIALSGAHRIK